MRSAARQSAMAPSRHRTHFNDLSQDLVECITHDLDASQEELGTSRLISRRFKEAADSGVEWFFQFGHQCTLHAKSVPVDIRADRWFMTRSLEHDATAPIAGPALQTLLQGVLLVSELLPCIDVLLDMMKLPWFQWSIRGHVTELYVDLQGDLPMELSDKLVQLLAAFNALPNLEIAGLALHGFEHTLRMDEAMRRRLLGVLSQLHATHIEVYANFSDPSMEFAVLDALLIGANQKTAVLDLAETSLSRGDIDQFVSKLSQLPHLTHFAVTLLHPATFFTQVMQALARGPMVFPRLNMLELVDLLDRGPPDLDLSHVTALSRLKELELRFDADFGGLVRRLAQMNMAPELLVLMPLEIRSLDFVALWNASRHGRVHVDVQDTEEWELQMDGQNSMRWTNYQCTSAMDDDSGIFGFQTAAMQYMHRNPQAFQSLHRLELSSLSVRSAREWTNLVRMHLNLRHLHLQFEAFVMNRRLLDQLCENLARSSLQVLHIEFNIPGYNATDFVTTLLDSMLVYRSTVEQLQVSMSEGFLNVPIRTKAFFSGLALQLFTVVKGTGIFSRQWITVYSK